MIERSDNPEWDMPGAPGDDVTCGNATPAPADAISAIAMCLAHVEDDATTYRAIAEDIYLVAAPLIVAAERARIRDGADGVAKIEGRRVYFVPADLLDDAT